MPQTQKQPRPIGCDHQLFIEDDLIESVTGLQRIVNQPVRHHANPVLTYQHPWEGNCVITWGSVLYDEETKLFKIWYEVYKKFAPPGETTILCYATSKDGITWEKPELGLVEYRGSKANNIVFAPKASAIDSPTVLLAPDSTPECRYRMYWYSFNERGIRGATSADGLNWNLIEGVLVNAGDRSSACYDPQRQKFLVITRVPGRGLRTCGLWESDNGENFRYVGEIAAPDDSDPENTEFYGMIYFPYAGLRLGFLEMFHVPLRKLNTQLIYSRDGLQWHRACDRQTFLDWGPPGSWDQAWVTPAQNPPLRVGDQLYIFYQGRQTLHWATAPFGHIGSVGLASLRVDGFVSLDAQCESGSVTTAPLLLEGRTLHLNACARPGCVTVEARDLNDKPIEGFHFSDCITLTMSDRTDHAVVWRNNNQLQALTGKPIRLCFKAQGAKLYSFWME
jgi:hypothetical protein